MRPLLGAVRGERLAFATLIGASILAACGLDPGGLAASSPAVDDGGGVDVVTPGLDAGEDVRDASAPDSWVAPPPFDSGDAPSGAQDAGCDASTSNDSHNCGVCGHDCAGESCVAGLCQPETITTQLGSPEFVRISGSTLYASTGGDRRVITCPTSGCGSNPGTVLTANSGDDLLGLAIDSTRFYTTEQNTGDMLTCTVSACGSPVRDVASGANGDGVTLDGAGHVFWIDETDSTKGPNTGFLLVAGTDGSNPNIVLTGLNQPIDVLFAGGLLYWTVQGDGTIQSCDPNNCQSAQVKTLVSGQPHPSYLAADSSHLYWTNSASEASGSDGSVVQANLDGSSVITLASNLPYPRGIVVDGAAIYFSNYVAFNSKSGTIMTCAVNGCGGTPTTLATGQGAPLGVATDTSYVYWAAEFDGAIRRVAK